MIQPLNLPSAGGINYSSGDVRHLSQGDAMDVPSIANPTRQLAERDNLITSKLNEVVGQVNNREQFVPLPVVRTIVAPGDQNIVSNYRIPAGFEARVLNASVASLPQSTNAQMDIYYNAGFGGVSGLDIVTTTPGAEFTGETNFHQQGEFIIAIKNTGALTLEISASVMLSMRPLGAVGSLLVGTVVQGEKGDPGMTGPQGPPGPPGTGSGGSSGMVWQGPWNGSHSYLVNDVVSYTLSTGVISSFISKVANVNEDPEHNPSVWDLVAQGGATGPAGTPGAPGSSGSNSAVPNYLSHVVYGTFTTGADWNNLPINGYSSYILGAGSTVNTIPLLESYVQSPVANPGYQREVSILGGVLRFAFRGNGTFTLPKAAYGAYSDYTNQTASLMVAVHGTIPYAVGSGSISTVTAIPTSTDSFVLKNLNSQELWTQISIFGFQTA